MRPLPPEKARGASKRLEAHKRFEAPTNTHTPNRASRYTDEAYTLYLVEDLGEASDDSAAHVEARLEIAA